MNEAELAEMLERFLGDAPDCGKWERDDFVSVEAEANLEPFRQKLILASIENHFDVPAIREIIRELKNAQNN